MNIRVTNYGVTGESVRIDFQVEDDAGHVIGSETAHAPLDADPEAVGEMIEKAAEKIAKASPLLKWLDGKQNAAIPTLEFKPKKETGKADLPEKKTTPSPPLAETEV